MRAMLASFHPARKAILASTVVIVLFPYLVMISTIFKPDEEIAGSQRWLPENATVEPFLASLRSAEVWGFVWNSLIIATGVTVVVLFCAIPASYVLARREFTGRDTFLDIALITQMLSPVVLIVALFRMFARWGLLESFASVIIASAAFVLPFAIWLLVGFFRGVSVEVEEAALVDGCSRFRILFSFIIPMSRPGIAATALYAFIFGWNEFIFALTFLSSSPDKWPITIGVFSNAGQWFVSWQPLMFLSLAGSLPILALFAVLQRQFEAGFSQVGQK